MFLSLTHSNKQKGSHSYLTCYSNPRSPSWKKLWTWKSGRSSMSWYYQLPWRRLIAPRQEKKGERQTVDGKPNRSVFKVQMLHDMHSWNVEYLLVSCLSQLSVSLLSFTVHLAWWSAQQAKNWEVNKWLKVFQKITIKVTVCFKLNKSILSHRRKNDSKWMMLRSFCESSWKSCKNYSQSEQLVLNSQEIANPHTIHQLILQHYIWKKYCQRSGTKFLEDSFI